MNRSRQAGFSFIEILVVMGIIAVLVSMVVTLVPMMQEKARRTQSVDNLRSIYIMMQARVTEKGWKQFKYNGKNFTLAPVAFGDVDKRKKDNLSIFFAPGDTLYTLDDVELEAYKNVSKASLKRGNEGFEMLTSYAGRRNAERDYMITPNKESMGTIILADDDDGPVHHLAGFVAAYSNGRVRFYDWDEFDLPEPEDPDKPDPWLGEEASNDELVALSSH